LCIFISSPSSEHPGLVKLRGFIAENLQRAIAHINASPEDPARIRLTFIDSWFHITNDGGFHDAHVYNQRSWLNLDDVRPEGKSVPP
jgi:hypothetical protein